MMHKFLLLIVLAAFPSCKSRYEFKGGRKDGALATPSSGQGESSKSSTTTLPKSTDTSTSTTTTTTIPGQSTTGANPEPLPSAPGGPVAGIDAYQNGQIALAIMTKVPVRLAPTEWTRDTDNAPGCKNPGIIQAVWTIDGKQFADLRRQNAADCVDLFVEGTFNSASTVKVELDVMSDDGEGTHAERAYSVIDPNVDPGSTPPTAGDNGGFVPVPGTPNPSGQNGLSGGGKTPTQSPTQN